MKRRAGVWGALALLLALVGCVMPAPQPVQIGPDYGATVDSIVLATMEAQDRLLAATLTAQPTLTTPPLPDTATPTRPPPTPMPVAPTAEPAATALPAAPGTSDGQPYYHLLPLLYNNSNVQGWMLTPHQTDASRPDYHYSRVVWAPFIAGGSGEAVPFNQAIQAWVDAEIASYPLGETPFDGPGGAFVNGRYAIASAVLWSHENGMGPYYRFPPYLDGEPAAMLGSQAVLRLGHDLVSVLFSTEAYLGGAHPGVHHTALNWDLSLGRALQLAELFRPSTLYLARLADICRQDLLARPDITYLDLDGGLAPVEENYRVWNLTPEGLVITFEEYQVAPYVYGPQQVLAPYNRLADLLDPAGPVGLVAQ